MVELNGIELGLSIRPLSPSNHKVEELQYSSCFQLEPASNRFKIPFP